MAIKKIRTFLVDDDRIYLEMLKDKLSINPKLTLKTFTTGEKCLENLDQNPEIIVLDYDFQKADNPEAKNGIAILKEIKKTHPEINVVMLSGQEKIEVAVATLNAGAYTYVVKNSSTFDKLGIVIQNILHRLHLENSNKQYKQQRLYLILALIAILLLNAMAFFHNPGAFSV
ncbi:response regulator [bacterium AH-315-C07]|nr:response regulator [bacterium AH-315-C07]